MLRALRAQRVEIKKCVCLHAHTQPYRAVDPRTGACSSSWAARRPEQFWGCSLPPAPPPLGEGAWVNGSKVLEKLG